MRKSSHKRQRLSGSLVISSLPAILRPFKKLMRGIKGIKRGIRWPPREPLNMERGKENIIR